MKTVTLRTHRKGHLVVRRFRLDVRGPGPRRTYSADTDRAVIGTHPSAELVLVDKAVSRFHAEITLLDDRVLIRDLDSRNGTRVDGVPILHAQLLPGAVITVGRTELRFDFAKDDVVLPLSERERFGLLVGKSRAMRAVFAVLERVAGTDATVLIEGETGTGKELAAESIHRESPRADRSFSIVDCTGLPATLLESELFGHERGAFTGADRVRRGLFESASGGTVFLDEIGEIDLELQPKLLRVLESGEFRRLGGEHARRTDVRIIAATNRELRAAVNIKKFRADLYYRLAVVPVRLPPLRERLDDLDLLVEAISTELGIADRPQIGSSELRARLRRHDWPGNVRELRNYLEAYVSLDVPPPLAARSDDETALPLAQARKEFERRYLEAMLRRHDGNVSRAARAAGVDRVFLYRMLWRSGLK